MTNITKQFAKHITYAFFRKNFWKKFIRIIFSIPAPTLIYKPSYSLNKHFF